MGVTSVILLDTHVWIWLLSLPGELSSVARSTIEAQVGDAQILVSAMSVWELSMLVKKGRLELKTDPVVFTRTTNQDPLFSFVPVDETIARRSVELPDIHSDPADRIILATAVELGCSIITKDRQLSEYRVAEVIW